MAASRYLHRPSHYWLIMNLQINCLPMLKNLAILLFFYARYLSAMQFVAKYLSNECNAVKDRIFPSEM